MITHTDVGDIPDQPGVYFFMKDNTPIYIGKSVNIRTRVKSHIAQAKLSKKEHAIVSQADTVEYRTTLSNFDALVYEAQLIRKYKPQYNVLWKDDKNFLYIKITIKDDFPKIYAVRKEDDGSSLYFGPFKSTHMTNKLLFELRRLVPFCTNRTIKKRGCFYSKLGYCDPCPNKVAHMEDSDTKNALKREYRRNIRKIITILSGDTREFISALEKQLKHLSDEQRYEEAIKVRSKLFQFSLFLDRRSFDENKHSINPDMDTLQKEVDEFLHKHFDTHLNGDAYRLECYDISNLFGKQSTGSMVVFQDGLFDKKEYRKFSVKRKGISDIHMMEEVLSRRLNHAEWRKPDIIILDGGKPQLRHVSKLFREQNIDIPLISIAKRPDRVLTPANDFKPVHVPKNSLLFKLIQSLRDESHRFAKKYHVALRNRNLLN